ncbi:hypothetical protein [Cyclobacterium sp. SYSU L10401]|uniref:hypothetical protein n=1 Tax=Cyclobacterium sp. SYSU L10401 TaxID=2678657 RepID=UPI0013D0AFE2|nr:hypothetical protein [Cyclobacterium sp. SYSU L10401]
MNRLLYPFWMVLLLFSCDSGNRDTGNKDTAWSGTSVFFEKLDSIRIKYLGSPTFHDIDPVSKKVLFMEHKETSQVITVADFEGSVLTSFSKWGDFPDTYGNLLASLKIAGNDSFMVYGSKGFLTYNFDGELQSLVKHTDNPYQGSTRIGLGFGMEPLGDGYLYINTGSSVSLPNGGEDYAALHPLVFLNPHTGETKPLLHFPKSSIFLKGKYFFRNAWAPAFTVSENKIAVVFGLEPRVYIFDGAAPHPLLEEIPLDLPDYRFSEGENEYSSDVRFFGQARTSGKILNIKLIDKYILVSYFPGFNSADKEASFANLTPEEAINFWKGMREKYPYRMAVFDASGNRLSDFEPKGLIASSMVLRNGQIWMQEKPDEEVERDYFRLFRVGLKIDRSDQ